MSLKSTINQLNQNQRTPYALIRIFLGLALLIRGVYIFINPDAIQQIASQENLFIWYSYIAIAHMVGGLLLTLGFFTRIGALIQIPILVSALFVVHSSEGLMMGSQSFELAALVLFLLCVFLVFGSGPIALKSYLK